MLEDLPNSPRNRRFDRRAKEGQQSHVATGNWLEQLRLARRVKGSLFATEEERQKISLAEVESAEFPVKATCAATLQLGVVTARQNGKALIRQVLLTVAVCL